MTVKNQSRSNKADRQQPKAEKTAGVSEFERQGPEAAPLERAMADPRSLSSKAVLQLQRRVGNRATQRLLAKKAQGSSSFPIQPKLVVGPSADRYEQEAEQVARQVVRPSASQESHPIQRHDDEDDWTHRKPLDAPPASLVQRHRDEEEVTLQRRADLQASVPAVEPDGAFEAGDKVASQLAARKGSGRPLPTEIRRAMEPRFGVDFSNVNVHTDTASAELNRALHARAFTHGTDVFFGAGNYDPGSTTGKHLLAHELTHVVQQGGASNQLQTAARSQPAALQRDADETAGPGATKRQRHSGPTIANITPLSNGSARPIQRGIMKYIGGLLGLPFGLAAGTAAGTLGGAYQGTAELGGGIWNRLTGGKHWGHKLYAWLPSLLGGVLGGVGGAAVGALRGFFTRRSWDMFNLFTKGREQSLSAKHGVQIGPGRGAGQHFSHGMLEQIDEVFSQLPAAHTQGNASLHGIRDTPADPESPIGGASAYDADTRRINIVRPELPGIGEAMPPWMYLLLSKGQAWMRRVMDQGAMSGMAGVRPQNDRDLQLGARTIFGGGTNALAHGSLFKWTIRHETGHSVDAQIDWTASRARLPQFGGWRQHQSRPEMQDIAQAFLTKAGIGFALTPVEMNPAHQMTTLRDEFTTMLEAGRGSAFDLGRGTLYQNLRRLAPNFDALWRAAVRSAKVALAQPWTLGDGGAADLQDNTGRIYHLDHYGTWVSYLAAARVNAVSNYQFSTPKEWFAEAYAAYYDPKPGVRDTLNAATRNWFARNLGERPGPGAAAAQPNLVNAGGNLQALTPDAATIDNLAGGGVVHDANLPADLQQPGGARLGGF